MVLRGGPDDEPLPVVVYFDDIAVYGDSAEDLIRNTAEAIKRLTKAGFMINLKKCQLVQEAAKVLGHNWTTGGYWTLVVTKLASLQDKTHEELA